MAENNDLQQANPFLVLGLLLTLVVGPAIGFIHHSMLNYVLEGVVMFTGAIFIGIAISTHKKRGNK